MKAPASRKDIPPQRRKQILDAAKELFSRSGYHGVTVDAIAERAGISKGNLYWYFKSKRDIFHLLFDDIVENLTMPSWKVIESDSAPQEKLRAIARIHLETAEANPEAVCLMLQLASQQELNNMVSSEYSLWIRHYIELLTPLFAAMGEKDAEAVAILYATTIDGLMALVVMGSGIYDKEKIMAVIEERFISFRGSKNV